MMENVNKAIDFIVWFFVIYIIIRLVDYSRKNK